MTESEFISRAAAIEAFDDPAVERYYGDVDPESVIRVIENIPAADVKPVVRGKWLQDYDFTEYDFDGSTPLLEPRKYQDGWQCSLCGQYMPSTTNFCPNCGADMREGS